MKNFRKMGRVDSEKKKVLGPIGAKVLYCRKYKIFQNIYCWHSALMTVPSLHSKYQKNP